VVAVSHDEVKDDGSQQLPAVDESRGGLLSGLVDLRGMLCGLFNWNNRICHALSVRNAMKGIAVVANVCRGLVRKRGDVTIPLQNMFAHQMGRFHLIGSLQEFIKRSKEAFPDRYLDAYQDPSETFRCMMAACRADKDADPLAAIFSGVVRFTISSEESPACGIHLGSREDVITSIHSAGYASTDNLVGWPADYLSDSLCQRVAMRTVESKSSV
jgi:hypothetical protein